jgi:hypothetical protein
MVHSGTARAVGIAQPCVSRGVSRDRRYSSAISPPRQLVRGSSFVGDVRRNGPLSDEWAGGCRRKRLPPSHVVGRRARAGAKDRKGAGESGG